VWPAAAEPRVRVGRTANVERERVGEHGSVSVGRTVENHDLVALADALPAYLGVAADRAAEQIHRAHPADDLVGRRARQAPVHQQARPLIGMLEEGEHPAGCGVTCCFVARHGQQQDEQVELLGRQHVALLVGLEQLGHDVVTGIVTTLRGEQVGVGVHLGGGEGAVVVGGLKLGVVVSDQPVGQVEQAIAVGRRRADQLANHVKGQRRRDVTNEVGLAAGHHVVDQLVAYLLHVLLQLIDHPWCEPAADELALAGVLRRVHVQHHQALQLYLVVGNLVEQGQPAM